MTTNSTTFENPAAISNTTQMTAGSGGNLAVCSTPNAPDFIPNSSGTNCCFSSTQVWSGTFSCRITPSVARVGLEWGSAVMGTLPTTNYHRFYMWKSATAGVANETLFKAWSGGGSTAQWILERNNTINALRLYNGADTIVWATGTFGLSNSNWYRIEIQEVQHATLGSVTAKVYDGNSLTELDSITSGNQNIGATNDLLLCSDATTVTSYYDNVVVGGATTWVGPDITVPSAYVSIR